MSKRLTAFELCTVVRKSGKGQHQIDCVKGLWGVSGSNKQRVLVEARRYFFQYYFDGEYNNILAKQDYSMVTA